MCDPANADSKMMQNAKLTISIRTREATCAREVERVFVGGCTGQLAIPPFWQVYPMQEYAPFFVSYQH